MNTETQRTERKKKRDSSAAGAVFADGFVDEGVEFGARQGDFFGGAFAGVASFGELGAATGWRSNLIACASGHELSDFAGREKLRFASEARAKSNLGEVLDDFHAVEGGEEIGAAGNRAVIGEEERVVVRDVRFKHGTKIGRAGRGVTHEGNFAETDHHFGKERLVQSLTGSGEARSGWRMRVTDGLNVRAHAIEQQMHAGFGGDLPMAVEVAAFEVHNDEVIRIHHALVEAGGRGEDALGIQTHGEIAFGGNNVSAFVEPASYAANVEAVLFFGAP